MVRLSGSQREILRRMDGGWIPFRLQFGSVGQSLERRGLISSTFDDQGRGIYVLTDRGRDALPKRAKATKATDQGRTAWGTMLTTANGTVHASQRGQPHRDVMARPAMFDGCEDERLVGLAAAFERADHAYLFGPSPAPAATTAARDETRTALARGVRTLAGGRWHRPGSGLLYEIQPDGSLLIYTPTVARPGGRATRDDAFASDQAGRPMGVLAGPPTKHCPRCEADKSLNKFRTSFHTADGRNPLCRPCQDSATAAGELRCSVCKELKSAAEFATSHFAAAGRAASCRECMAKRDKDRRAGIKAEPAAPVYEKYCPACKSTKARAQFYTHRGTADGLTRECRVCYRARSKANKAARIKGGQAAI